MSDSARMSAGRLFQTMLFWLLCVGCWRQRADETLGNPPQANEI